MSSEQVEQGHRPSIWACEKNHAHLFVRLRGNERCPHCALEASQQENERLRKAINEAIEKIAWEGDYGATDVLRVALEEQEAQDG